MAENVEGRIGIYLDTNQASAQLRDLQARITKFQTSAAQAGAAATKEIVALRQGLISSINATGQFSASMVRVKSATESFTHALENNKMSMGEYFRYAGASTKTFGKLFKNELETINQVVESRVRTIGSRFIGMGRDANGALQAIKIRPLSADLSMLDNQMIANAQRMQLFNQLVKQGSTQLLNWGKNTQWAGRQLMVGFTIPLTMMGSAAAKSFMELERQTIAFKRVYGDLNTTTEQIDKMAESMKNVALEFTKYGVAVADTMDLAAKAAAMGKTGADLQAQVRETSRLAVLGQVEQQQALDTTISLTNAFGTAAEELAGKIDFLNAVENQTVTSIEDLTVAIPKAGPVVKQLGGNVEDLTFFLTAMREGGINASEGANALKSGLASLINPTDKATEMLKGFGINIQKIVQANKGDVKGLVIDFAKALDTLDPLNRARAIEQLFGKFQFSRLSTLFQNVIKDGSQANKVLSLTNESSAALAILSKRELSKISESTTFKFQKAMADFQAALAPVGEEFLKAVTPIIEFGTKLLNQFNSLSDGAKQIGVYIAAGLGVVGPTLLMIVGLVANGIANILNFGRSIFSTFQKLKFGTKDAVLSTEYLTQAQLEELAATAQLDAAHSKIRSTFMLESKSVDMLTAAYKRAAAAQAQLAAYSPASGKYVPKVSKRYASGVVSVPGPKGAGDVVPAMLSPGESVIPSAMTKKYGGLIQAMISDKVPGYMAGRIGNTYKIGTGNGIDEKQIEAALAIIANPPRSYGHVNTPLQEAKNLFVGIADRLAIEKADVYRRQEIADVQKILESGGLQSKFGSGQAGRGGYQHLDDARLAISQMIYGGAAEGKPGSEIYGYLRAPVLPFDTSELTPIISRVASQLGIEPSMLQNKLDDILLSTNEGILKKPLVSGYGEVDLKFNRAAMMASNAQTIIGDTLSSSTNDLMQHQARLENIKAMSIGDLFSGRYTKQDIAAMFGPSNVPNFYEVAIPQSAAKVSNIDEAILSGSIQNKRMVDPVTGQATYMDVQTPLSQVKKAQSAFGKAGIPFRTSSYVDDAMMSLLNNFAPFGTPTAKAASGLSKYVDLNNKPITLESALRAFQQVPKGGNSWDRASMIWKKIPKFASGGIVNSLGSGMSQSNRAVVAFGAHQPFTTAHQMIAQQGMERAKMTQAEFLQFTTMQGKSGRSIIDDELKQKMIAEALGIDPKFAKNPFDLMAALSASGYKNVDLLLGQDRMSSDVWDIAAKEYGIDLNKIGIPRPKGSPSGTAARAAAAAGNKEAFMKLLATGISDKTSGSIFSILFSKLSGIKKYANGIFSVPGPKGAGDVVPAMLSPGESVIPSAMTKKYGGLINGMIADNIPGYENGLGAETKGYTNLVNLFSEESNAALNYGKANPASLAKELQDAKGAILAPLTYELATQLGATTQSEVFSMVRGNSDLVDLAKLTSSTVAEELATLTGKIGDKEYSEIFERHLKKNAQQFGQNIQDATNNALTQITTYEDKSNYRMRGKGSLEPRGRSQLLSGVRTYKTLKPQYMATAGEFFGGGVLPKNPVLAHTTMPQYGTLSALAAGKTLSNEAMIAEELAKSGQLRIGLRGQSREGIVISRAELEAIRQEVGGSLSKAARQIMAEIEAGIRQVTKTASPSQEMHNLGADIGQGAINGLSSKIDDAQKAGANLGQAAVNGTQSRTRGRRVQREAGSTINGTFYPVGFSPAPSISEKPIGPLTEKEYKKQQFAEKHPTLSKIGSSISGGIKGMGGMGGMGGMIAAGVGGSMLSMIPGMEMIGSTIAMVGPMLMMMLPAAILPPVLAVVAGLTLLIGGMSALSAAIEEQRKKAVELANATVMSQNALEKMSVDLGTVSETEKRKNKEDAKFFQTSQRKLSAAEQYIQETESGQKLLSGINAQLQAGTSTIEIGQTTAANIANAVAQNVITKEQGVAIIAALGRLSGNSSIGTFGLQQFNAYTSDISKAPEKISEQTLGMIRSQSYMGRGGTNAPAGLIAMSMNAYGQAQAGTDAINAQYDTLVASAKTQKEINRLEKERTASLTANRNNTEAIRIEIEKQAAGMGTAFDNEFKANIEQTFGKESPAYKTAEKIASLPKSKYKTKLEMDFAGGTISQPMAEWLVNQAMNNDKIAINYEVTAKVLMSREDERKLNALEQINPAAAKAGKQQEKKGNGGGNGGGNDSSSTGGGTNEDPRLTELQNKLDKRQKALNVISLKEEQINKVYEERRKALEKIADINRTILEQQRGQLDIANALASGDIAAAARAVQEQRIRAAQFAQEQQMKNLEEQRQQAVSNINFGGMSRKQLEEVIAKLNMQIAKREYQTAAMGGMIHRYSNGGSVMSYFAGGGKAIGTDTVPAMLTPGEFVVKRPAVQKYGVDKLQAINNGTAENSSVYNYSVTVNANSSSNADEIANTVLTKIKRLEGQRIRGNNY